MWDLGNKLLGFYSVIGKVQNLVLFNPLPMERGCFQPPPPPCNFFTDAIGSVSSDHYHIQFNMSLYESFILQTIFSNNNINNKFENAK